MSISRSDLEKGLIDFSGKETVGTINPIHPGEILLEEFLEPLNISLYALAKRIDVPHNRVSDIVKSKRSITIDTAQRLALALNTSAEFWLNLQNSYDLRLLKKDKEKFMKMTEIKPFVTNGPVPIS